MFIAHNTHSPKAYFSCAADKRFFRDIEPGHTQCASNNVQVIQCAPRLCLVWDTLYMYSAHCTCIVCISGIVCWTCILLHVTMAIVCIVSHLMHRTPGPMEKRNKRSQRNGFWMVLTIWASLPWICLIPWLAAWNSKELVEEPDCSTRGIDTLLGLDPHDIAGYIFVSSLSKT